MHTARTVRDFMDAQAFWADPKWPLEESLRSFHRATDMNAGHLMLLAVWTCQQICSDVPNKVDLASFDRFRNRFKRLHSFRDCRSPFNDARLMLHHPRKTDSHPFQRFLRTYVDDRSPWVQKLLKSSPASVKVLLYNSIVRAAQGLNSDGDAEAAREVLDLGKTLRSDIISENGFLYFEVAPQYLRPRPHLTPNDIERGVHS